MTRTLWEDKGNIVDLSLAFWLELVYEVPFSFLIYEVPFSFRDRYLFRERGAAARGVPALRRGRQSRFRKENCRD